MARHQVTVVGSFVMDLIGLVDEFPKDGQTVIGKGFYSLPGGKGANQAVAAARLGASVRMIGRLGADAYGDEFVRLFEREGIAIDRVRQIEGQHTALGLIQINQRAENKIVVIPGANYDYSPDDAQSDAADYLDSDFVVVQLELRNEVTYDVIRRCHAAGVPVVLNPAPAVPLPKEILACVSYLTPNETELAILSGLPTETQEEVEAAVKTLLGYGVRNIVATLGAKGALVANGEGLTYVPGYRVEAIDTVAAGDSFNGAMVARLSAGDDLIDAVRYANAVGALTVTKKGAIPSLPTAAEVRDFLRAVDHGK